MSDPKLMITLISCIALLVNSNETLSDATTNPVASTPSLTFETGNDTTTTAPIVNSPTKAGENLTTSSPSSTPETPSSSDDPATTPSMVLEPGNGTTTTAPIGNSTTEARENVTTSFPSSTTETPSSSDVPASTPSVTFEPGNDTKTTAPIVNSTTESRENLTTSSPSSTTETPSSSDVPSMTFEPGNDTTTTAPIVSSTTEAWENLTTSSPSSTTETPSSSDVPGELCCDVLTLDPLSSPFIPSDVATVNTACTCTSSNGTYCPKIYIDEEAEGLISYNETHNEESQSRCTSKVTIKAVASKFNGRSFEVPAKSVAGDKTLSFSLRFEKSGNGERCKRDFDCWYSQDQICGDYGHCICYKDKPSFVREEEKCFSASAYGEMCMHDEQCISKDNHTICDDKVKRCHCMKDYIPKNVSDPVCITASAYGEMCMYDEQCISKDIHTICDDKVKRCYCKKDYHPKSDSDPVCITASAYGEMCMYDEQCISKDNHTICDYKVKRCYCKKDFHPKSDSDPVCITGSSQSSDQVIPCQAVIIGSAIISMLFVSLKI